VATTGFTKASTSVVTDRSYSLYSRSTSELIDSAHPGWAAANSSRTRCSWTGLA
jgi:hypothetical protein